MLNLQNFSTSSWQIWHQHTNSQFLYFITNFGFKPWGHDFFSVVINPPLILKKLIVHPAILFASYNINLFSAEDKLINTMAGMK